MTDNDNEDWDNAAEMLSETTGRPKEEFEPPEDVEYPDLDELTMVPADEWRKDISVVKHIAQLVEEGEIERAVEALRLTAWKSWCESWNCRGSTDSMDKIEEQAAKTEFDRYWRLNYE